MQSKSDLYVTLALFVVKDNKMKTSIMLYLIFALIPFQVIAETKPTLSIESEKSFVRVGYETSVDLTLQNVPPLYGVEMVITFPEKFFEVVDSGKQSDIQIEPGNYFDPKKSHFLINKADNTKGIIWYTMSLLNPAPPPSSNNGRLCKFYLKAKQPGKGNIKIASLKVASYDGKPFDIDFEEASKGITLIASDKSLDPNESKSSSNQTLIIILLSSIVVLLLIIIFRQNKK